MPSAKKIAPKIAPGKIATATKSKAAVSKAAVSETKSHKQRSSKISGSGSKEKAKSTTVATAAGKSRKPAAAQARRSETRSKTAAKRSAAAGRVAKSAAAPKTARTERSKTAVNARGAAPSTTAAASRKQALDKQTQKKAAKAQSSARASISKRQEKSAASLPRVTRKKAASVQETAGLKVARGKAAKETRTAIAEEAVSQTINSVSVVSEAVVILGAEPAPPPSAAEPQARASEPATVTLGTSDHQPVTQRTQKKTAAAPAATIAGAAEAVSVAPVAATPVVKPAAPKAVAPEARPRDVKPAVNPAEEGKPADKPVAAKPAKAVAKPAFKTAEFIVYPAHGVGQIIAIEEQEVAGFKLELFVISFVKDKMILKVPVPKAASVGMRKLGSADVVKKALATLSGRARIKRTMWSRRAQEYEAKINSGDLVAIAEVVRDLYRSEAQPEQSYSERQLYEAALDRVAREIAVVQKLTETESLRLIEGQLQKGPRRSKVEEAESDLADADEGDIEEAA